MALPQQIKHIWPSTQVETTDKGWVLCMLLSMGLCLKMNKNSKILKPLLLLQMSKIVKCSRVMGAPHDSACSLILLCEGWAKTLPVRRFHPECSATLDASNRDVDPMYSDAHCAQLNL